MLLEERILFMLFISNHTLAALRNFTNALRQAVPEFSPGLLSEESRSTGVLAMNLHLPSVCVSLRLMSRLMMTVHPLTLVLCLAGPLMLCNGQASAEEKKAEGAPAEKVDPKKDDGKKADSAKVDKDGWKPLFNGKDLEGWKITNFGGEGEVFVENGEVVISQGADLSGIHTEQEIPKSNYEIQFEAQREAGSDFFAGLTFPVKDSHCSLILGGWGGGVCGISSLNGMDASENETTSYQAFEKGKWYKIKVIVRDNHLHAWIDDAKVVDVDTTGMRVGTRFEVDRSKPFGFSTYATTGRLKNVRVRSLPPEDAK